MTSNEKSFIPYGRQSITEADVAAVSDVLRSPFLTQSPVVPAFGRQLPIKWIYFMESR